MEKKKTNADDFSLEEIIGCNSTQPTVLNKPDSISVSNQPSQPDKENRQCETTLPDRSEKKSVSAKQRKIDLTEYKDIFLKVPKITDRKNVFISNNIREMIVGIVRLFGGEKTSVSGFLENLVLHHFEIYAEDLRLGKDCYYPRQISRVSRDELKGAGICPFSGARLCFRHTKTLAFTGVKGKIAPAGRQFYGRSK